MAQTGPPVAARYDLLWARARGTKACAMLEISSLSAPPKGGKKGTHKGCAAQRGRAPGLVGVTPRSQSQRYYAVGILPADLNRGTLLRVILSYPMATLRWSIIGVRLADSDKQGIGGRGHWCQKVPVQHACFSLACSFRDPSDINGRQKGDKARAWDMRLSGRVPEGRATRCRYSVVEDVRARRHCSRKSSAH